MTKLLAFLKADRLDMVVVGDQDQLSARSPLTSLALLCKIAVYVAVYVAVLYVHVLLFSNLRYDLCGPE